MTATSAALRAGSEVRRTAFFPLRRPMLTPLACTVLACSLFSSSLQSVSIPPVAPPLQLPFSTPSSAPPSPCISCIALAAPSTPSRFAAALTSTAVHAQRWRWRRSAQCRDREQRRHAQSAHRRPLLVCFTCASLPPRVASALSFLLPDTSPSRRCASATSPHDQHTLVSRRSRQTQRQQAPCSASRQSPLDVSTLFCFSRFLPLHLCSGSVSVRAFVCLLCRFSSFLS